MSQELIHDGTYSRISLGPVEKDDIESIVPMQKAKCIQRGKFTVKKWSEEGQSSSVFFLGVPLGDGRVKAVACKMVDKMRAQRDFVWKFLPRELDALSLVKHPNVVTVYKVVDTLEKSFILMRYEEGGDLLDYLTQHGRLEEFHTRLWMRQLFLATRYLHRLGIVHRDIKCENVLISARRNLKLTDFGLCRESRDSVGLAATSATYCGTQQYAAPEVVACKPYVLPSCDIWSLGVVFFVMVENVLPFRDVDMKTLLQDQWDRAYAFRPDSRFYLNQNGKDSLKSMLEPEPSKRATLDSLLVSRWMRQDPKLLELVPGTL